MNPRTRPVALLSCGIALVLAAGCAHSSNRAQAEDTRTVSADDLQRNPNVPIEQVLMSRVPGAWITRTSDGGIAIRLRGTTTIHGSNEPLYIVDGMPIRAGVGGALTGVNPYDIQSIEVLTDIAETAMYGVRGANGVIIVTTKGSASAQ